jgi:glycerol uptake facilitator-like aquaporin
MSKKLLAEFLGTFWLVFGGCGSAVLAAAFPELGIGFVGVALAFGLTVLTMAYQLAASRAAISIRRCRSACWQPDASTRKI